MTQEKSTSAALLRTDDALEPLLARAVAEWRAAGINVAGVLAEPHGLPGRACGAGLLRDIASGAPQRIYLETAPATTSCHLDATGVEAACRRLTGQIAISDLVVLSKFGKLEAAGGGLAPTFRAALAAGKPLLTTVSEKHLDAWRAFAPGAVLLEGAAALAAWWRRLAPRPAPTRAA